MNRENLHSSRFEPEKSGHTGKKKSAKLKKRSKKTNKANFCERNHSTGTASTSSEGVQISCSSEDDDTKPSQRCTETAANEPSEEEPSTKTASKRKKIRKVTWKKLKKRIPGRKPLSRSHSEKKGNLLSRIPSRKAPRRSRSESAFKKKKGGFPESPTKASRPTLGDWGVCDDDKDNSETSDYGMSTYTDLLKSATIENDDDASSNDSSSDSSLYTDGSDDDASTD